MTSQKKFSKIKKHFPLNGKLRSDCLYSEIFPNSCFFFLISKYVINKCHICIIGSELHQDKIILINTNITEKNYPPPPSPYTHCPNSFYNLVFLASAAGQKVQRQSQCIWKTYCPRIQTTLVDTAWL